MQKPSPASGLVVRYDYLWRDEARKGRQEGAKVRPCAIVVARKIEPSGDLTVLLAPITHSPPSDPNDAIELPPRLKAHLGLDDARSWIVVNEVNSALWSDPGIVPVNSSRWEYGSLPPKLATAVHQRIIEKHRQNRLKIVGRD